MNHKIKLRSYLLPLGLLYGAGVSARNFLFDHEIKKSVEFDLPVIGVGNLSTGGTGKTPHIEYLIRLLQDSYDLGVLSRGYKRKSTGYLLASNNSTAHQIGDEPLQIKRKFGKVMVAVCEERVIGIPIMLLDNPSLQVILLDDAFQHRQVKPGLSIITSDYKRLYTRDRILPVGNLREPVSNVSRSDIIIITKCPADISSEERKEISREINPGENQAIYYSSLEYDTPYPVFNVFKHGGIDSIKNALLVTGIASPSSMFEELKNKGMVSRHLAFGDHHNFSVNEVKRIITNSVEISKERPVIFTTEKDITRLMPHHDRFVNEKVEIYCVPVRVKFLDDDEAKFNSAILRFIESKLKQNDR